MGVLGWFSLSLSDWAKLVPFGVAVGGLSYLLFRVSLILPSLGRLSRRNSPCFPGLNPTELTRPSRWSVLRSWTLWTSRTWETRGSSAGAGSLRSFPTVTDPTPSTTRRQAIMWGLLLSRSQVNHQS